MFKDNGVTIIVRGASCDGDRTTLAVNLGIRRSNLFFQCSRICNELEGRSRLVNIAYRMIAQQLSSRMAKIIGIKSRADCKRQNLSRMRILHYDGAVDRLRALHIALERLLRHELNVSVKCQNQILARKRVALFAAKNMPSCVKGRQHVSRRAVQIVVKV